MSEEARANGWRGFDGIGDRVSGGWLYRCDGMTRMSGCGSEIIISRRYVRVGEKSTGWLVCYGKEPKPDTPGEFGDPIQWEDDHDVVLTFCPSCAAVVREQEARRR